MTLCAHCHTPLSRWHNRPLCWPCLTRALAIAKGTYDWAAARDEEPDEDEWFDVRGREEDAA